MVRVSRLQVRGVCCGQGVKTSGEGCVLWSGCEDFR